MDRLQVPIRPGNGRKGSISSLSSCDSTCPSIEFDPSLRRPSSSLFSLELPRTPSPTTLKIQDQPEYRLLISELEKKKGCLSTSEDTTIPRPSSANAYMKIRTPDMGRPKSKRKVTFVEDDSAEGVSKGPGSRIKSASSVGRSSSQTSDEWELDSRRASLTRPRTAPVRRSSIGSTSSSLKFHRPGSADNKKKMFDADQDFPAGIGSVSSAGVHNVTMHLEDLQNPGRLITITMSYSASATHNSKVFCSDIIRANKKREKAINLLVKEIEHRLAAQHKRREQREKQRAEEEDRERRRLEEEIYDRGMKPWRAKEEDSLKRRDVSLLTTTDVKQLRRKRISRHSLNTKMYTGSSRKSIYSERAVV